MVANTLHSTTMDEKKVTFGRYIKECKTTSNIFGTRITKHLKSLCTSHIIMRMIFNGLVLKKKKKRSGRNM